MQCNRVIICHSHVEYFWNQKNHCSNPQNKQKWAVGTILLSNEETSNFILALQKIQPMPPIQAQPVPYQATGFPRAFIASRDRFPWTDIRERFPIYTNLKNIPTSYHLDRDGLCIHGMTPPILSSAPVMEGWLQFICTARAQLVSVVQQGDQPLVEKIP